jgi:2-polyprenyl-6-methoxyphenol hydroxylase-like FAD-dependent oxidoreductase/esterase/lipase
MTQNRTPRIAIIGAGPGGLTLARVLQTRHIAATVFERESHPDERPQGGTLDLHPESGLLAVHLAGLDEQFRAIARYEDQGGRFVSKEGQILLANEPNEESGDRPEVDRTELRAMLLDSLDPGVVRWGCNLLSIHQTDDGSYELLFEHGLTEIFDLVVGADGAWSRVRPLLSSVTPFYTGVTFIEAGLDEVEQKHPALAQLVGHGSMFALADNKGLIAQRNGHGHIRVYAAMRVSETWVSESGFDASHPEAARAWLLDQFPNWDQSLLALIKESNDRFVIRSLYMLPVGHSWEFHAGVTLLGDSAHLMSPFSGEGVNLAMLDATELACALSDNQSLDDAVRNYEQKMFPRALTAARDADEGLKRALAPDSATGALAFFREIMSAEPPLPPKIRRESFADGLTVRVDEQGSGRPILVLHGAGGPPSVSGFVEALAEHAHVLAPIHPGFAGEPRPEWFTGVDDLALVYLDLLERLDLQDVIVIGFSFGGWIAAELAVRSTTRLSGLILVDAAGIQVDGHEIVDMFSRRPDASSAPSNEQTAPFLNAPVTQSPEQVAARASNFQTLTVYGREQGMRDSKLRRRLARVRIPALVAWGENDNILDSDYGRAYAQALPNARFALIPEAGHFPQIEQPERLLNLVQEFADSITVLPPAESFEQH